MTNGPVDFLRQVQRVEDFIRNPSSWGELEKAFAPAKVPDNFDPGDFMKQQLAALYGTQDGRAIIEWLFDLTLRAPYPHVGNSRDSAWLAAGKHESRVAVGQAIAKAIVDGRELFNQKEPKT
jgi:hypothetical protein